MRTIEHGTYLDEEACQAMRETGAILVPTRTAVQETLHGATLPPFARPKLAAIADRHAQAVTLAHERGVTIAMGTDISVSGAGLANSWGRNGRELPLLVQAGLTPLEAIQAATANGPLTLSPQGPRSGQLAEGYDADLIIVDGDPLADITILADPAHVAGMWKSDHRRGPAARRIRLRERLPGRAHDARRQDHPDLRGHQPDPAHDHGPPALKT